MCDRKAEGEGSVLQCVLQCVFEYVAVCCSVLQCDRKVEGERSAPRVGS